MFPSLNTTSRHQSVAQQPGSTSVRDTLEACDRLASLLYSVVDEARHTAWSCVDQIVKAGEANPYPLPEEVLRECHPQISIEMALWVASKVEKPNLLQALYIHKLHALRNDYSAALRAVLADMPEGGLQDVVERAFRTVIDQVARRVHADPNACFQADFFKQAARLWKAALTHSHLQEQMRHLPNASSTSFSSPIILSVYNHHWQQGAMLELLFHQHADLATNCPLVRACDRPAVVLNLPPDESHLYRHSQLSALSCTWVECAHGLCVGSSAEVELADLERIGALPLNLPASVSTKVWVVRLWLRVAPFTIAPCSEYGSEILNSIRIRQSASVVNCTMILLEAFIPSTSVLKENANKGHFAYYWVPTNWREMMIAEEGVCNAGCRVVEATRAFGAPL
jgi:hypothetical protein